MKWYYKVMGGHTHVRVFMNGAKCGDLCFRNVEFQEVLFAGTNATTMHIEFIDESAKVCRLCKSTNLRPPKFAKVGPIEGHSDATVCENCGAWQ